jgi:hypothetical protein
MTESTEFTQDGLFPDPKPTVDTDAIREAALQRTNPSADVSGDRQEAYLREQGGQKVPAEFSREQILADIAERKAQRMAEQESSPTAQAARLRAEIARKLEAGEPIGDTKPE